MQSIGCMSQRNIFRLCCKKTLFTQNNIVQNKFYPKSVILSFTKILKMAVHLYLSDLQYYDLKLDSIIQKLGYDFLFQLIITPRIVQLIHANYYRLVINFKYIQIHQKSSPAGLVLEFEIWRLKVITFFETLVSRTGAVG